MKLDLSKLTDKIAISCNTKTKTNEFLKQVESAGIYDNLELPCNYYRFCGEYTCFSIDNNKRVSLASIAWCEKNDYIVIPFEIFIINENYSIELKLKGDCYDNR